MADTTYVDNTTVITADTMNDLNRLHYTILSDPADAAAVRTALGISNGSTDITMTAASIIEAEGAAVASASSCNIWATDGNTRHITGTTTIADFATAPQAGAWMKVIFDSALTLTQSANLNLNGGGSDITVDAGAMALVYADTTTQMDVFVIRKDGTAVVSASSGVTSVSGTAPVVSSGGATPAISMAAATASVNGYMTSTYASKLDGIAAGATVGVPVDVTAGGVGVIYMMIKTTAGLLSNNATIAATSLQPAYSADGLTWTGTGSVTGTWRNISGGDISQSQFGHFQRIS